jgi:hypothetical protein
VFFCRLSRQTADNEHIEAQSYGGQWEVRGAANDSASIFLLAKSYECEWFEQRKTINL